MRAGSIVACRKRKPEWKGMEWFGHQCDTVKGGSMAEKRGVAGTIHYLYRRMKLTAWGSRTCGKGTETSHPFGLAEADKFAQATRKNELILLRLSGMARMGSVPDARSV